MQSREAQAASNSRLDDTRNVDIVQRYLADVRRHEVLTRDEERIIAEHFRATADANAEQKLVNSNLRLVVKIALEYQSGRVNLLDLIQEGNVGLIHAVRKFDHEKNIRLASYAQWWIRAYILKYLMDNHKLVKVGTTQAQRKLFYNLKKERENLVRQGLVPTASMLARALAVRERDVIEMESRLSGTENSLDAPLRDGENGTLGDVISDESALLDDEAVRDETAQRLRACLEDFAETLEGRDVDIWYRRMISDEPRTLQEIGDLFGVSRERARQLEARIARRLEKYLRDRMGKTEPLEFPLFA